MLLVDRFHQNDSFGGKTTAGRSFSTSSSCQVFRSRLSLDRWDGLRSQLAPTKYGPNVLWLGWVAPSAPTEYGPKGIPVVLCDFVNLVLAGGIPLTSCFF